MAVGVLVVVVVVGGSACCCCWRASSLAVVRLVGGVVEELLPYDGRREVPFRFLRLVVVVAGTITVDAVELVVVAVERRRW